MKKILFFLIVLCGISNAQFIKTVGDTTDLKLTSGSGIVLLEQYGKGNLSGGGLFHRIDSTYTEGIDAFDYPTMGFQWARIGIAEYGDMYIASSDTTALTTDSTYYAIDGFTAGNRAGVTLTTSSATLTSNAFYSFSANFAYKATDSVHYNIALFKNGVIDTEIQKNFEVADNSTAIQNLSIGGIVYSDGNDVFAIKVAILDNLTSKQFIVKKANVKFIKLN